MSVPSLAPFVLKRPWLLKALTPVANWYANAAGYRQIGLKYVAVTRPSSSFPLRLPPIEQYSIERLHY